MKTAKKMVVVSIALALGMSSAVDAAAQREEDSAYKWGRWAVLSPAAGGEEPYAAALAPVAVNNARPQDADEFNPEILSSNPPAQVESFCSAGADCGYATYYKDFDEEGVENDRFASANIADGLEESGNNSDGGPVLARFDLETFPLDDGEGQYEIEGVGGSDGEGEGARGARFEVSDTGDENFPDIESVEMEDSGGEYFGREQSVVRDRTENGDPRTKRASQTSFLEEIYDFDNVDTGIWIDEKDSQTRVNTGAPSPTIFDFFSAGGYFAFGRTPTIDQMQAFAAGNAIAIYQGVVLDYESAVTMEFNFRNDTVQASFASENGFEGFDATGAIDGVNFSGVHGDHGHGFQGSFFSGGENVSGAVINPTQLGIFSADHVHPRVAR